MHRVLPHWEPSSSLCTGSFLLSEGFDQLVDQKQPSPSKAIHESCRESHQSSGVASFAVLSNSAPKRKSRLVKPSDFGSRFRSARFASGLPLAGARAAFFSSGVVSWTGGWIERAPGARPGPARIGDVAPLR
jgi:hypothetical protein